MSPRLFKSSESKLAFAHSAELTKSAYSHVKLVQYLIGLIPFPVLVLAINLEVGRKNTNILITLTGLILISFFLYVWREIPTSTLRAAKAINSAQPDQPVRIYESTSKLNPFRSTIELEYDLHLQAFGKPVYGLNSYVRSVVPIYYLASGLTLAVVIANIFQSSAALWLAVFATIFNLFYTVVSDSAIARISTLLTFIKEGQSKKSLQTNYPREQMAAVNMPDLNLPDPDKQLNHDHGSIH